MWVRGEKYLGFLKLYTAEPGVLGWHSEAPTVCISITKSSYVKKITSSLGKASSTDKADFLCLLVFVNGIYLRKDQSKTFVFKMPIYLCFKISK